MLHTTLELPPVHEMAAGIPAPVSEALRQGLAKDPAQRHPDCSSLARALLAGMGAAPAVGPPPGQQQLTTCPACRQLIRLPSQAGGMKVICPACQAIFVAAPGAAALEATAPVRGPGYSPAPGSELRDPARAETLPPPGSQPLAGPAGVRNLGIAGGGEPPDLIGPPTDQAAVATPTSRNETIPFDLAQSPPQGRPEHPKPAGGRARWLALLLACVLVAAGVGGYLAFFPPGGGEANGPKKDTSKLTNGGGQKPPVLAKAFTNSAKMKMVPIPAGKFLMGSPDVGQDPDANEDEWPRRLVKISKPFYMAAHEVTLGQFREFLKETGYKPESMVRGRNEGYDSSLKVVIDDASKYSWEDAGFEQTDDHPVVNVTWNDAAAYCLWLSKKEKRTYRLPTEAEWEYACRAGASSRFAHGDIEASLRGAENTADDLLKDKLSVADGWRFQPWSDEYAFTAPGGKFRPNAWGLYDMQGNVAEWCSDYYDREYYKSGPQSDPQGPAPGPERVCRGGSWRSPAWACRCANRDNFPLGDRFCHVGFRVVCDAE
jgi:formylglycine-generating enzyme required for sulfatase activity